MVEQRTGPGRFLHFLTKEDDAIDRLGQGSRKATVRIRREWEYAHPATRINGMLWKPTWEATTPAPRYTVIFKH
ncbi:hypothetical protein [Candidatus Nitrososphaera gargensis]|uniref:hypothetical protein n=1 Tax=Candidatus Nitrososphaera gargensis TaxID=497727 RepID=UPI0011E56FC2|nr:hypothetical protein [Candidatus Nitrososphaera gargensis]